MPAIIRSGNGDNSTTDNGRQLIIKNVPGLMAYTEGDPLDLSGLEVQFKDKTKDPVLLASESYTTTPANEAIMNRSNNTITIMHTTDDGETLFASFSVLVKYPTGISIMSLPKTKYDVNETISLDDVVVNLNYSDGSFKKLETSSVVFNPTTGTAITKNISEVTATYTDPKSGRVLTDSKSIFVRYISGIAVTTMPKTSYIEGEVIDISNLKATLLYNDGLSMQLLSDEITVSPASGSSVSRENTSLRVTHIRSNGEAFTAEVPLKVKYAVGIVVEKKPNKVNYKVGDTLSLTGVKINIVYNDTSTQTITDYVSVPAAGEVLTKDNSNIVFSYLLGGKTYEVSQVISVKYVESISFITSPKSVYAEGERLDLSEMALQANYNDGTTTPLLESDYIADPANNTILNRTNKAVRVTYLNGGKEFSVSEPLEIIYPESLTLVAPPKSVYKANDLLDLTALRVNLNYNDGSFKKVTNYTTDPRGGTTLTINDRTLTITYTDKEKPITLIHPILVEDDRVVENTTITNTVTGIKITTPPKSAYREGELLDLDGMIVKAIKSNGTSEIIDGYETTPANGVSLIRDTSTVAIKYVVDGTPYVTVQPISVKYHTGISLSKRPKVEYIEGSPLDVTGMVVNLVFNDNSTEEVFNYTCEPEIGTPLSKTTTAFTITYAVDGQTYTFRQPIVVKERVINNIPSVVTPTNSPIVGIKITTPPNKIEYREYERFSATGMVVKAIREDGTSEVIDGYTVNPADGDQLRRLTNSITAHATIGGNEFTSETPLKVKWPIRLAVHVSPRLNYVAGEALDLNGMVVKVIYSDGSEEMISNYTTLPEAGTKLTTANNKIEISYRYYEDTLTYNQKIVVKPDSSASPTIDTQAKPTGIRINRMPTKLFYANPEEDLNDITIDMQVVLIYDNDTMLEVTDYEYEFVRYIGDDRFNVKIKYDNNDQHFEIITMLYKLLFTGVEIVRLPEKVVFSVGDTLTYEGLEVHAKYNDGSTGEENYLTENPSCRVYIEDDDGAVITKSGMRRVVIKPNPQATESMYAYYNIYAAPRINAVTPPATSETNTGTTVPGNTSEQPGISTQPSESNLITPGSGNAETTTPGNSATEQPNVSQPGSTSPEIQPKVKIVPAEVSPIVGLKVVTPPNKTSYLLGEDFDSTGMVVHFLHEDGSTTAIPNAESSISYEDDTNLSNVTPDIRIVYRNEATRYSISYPVEVAYPTAIFTYREPNKIKYDYGETFDPTGMEVKVLYNNGKIADVRLASCTLTPSEALTVSDTAITISYSLYGSTYTTTVPIHVDDQRDPGTPVALEVLSMPRVSYVYGERYNWGGLRVALVHDNGVKKEIYNYTVSPAAQEVAVENENLTISYTAGEKQFTTTVSITVYQPVGVKVLSMPNKVTYIEGDYFDPTGMVIAIAYNNAENPYMVITDYHFNKDITLSPLTVEDTGIEISCRNEYIRSGETTVPIVVTDAEGTRYGRPSTIRIDKMPANVDYRYGDILDLTGLAVSIVYEDGQSRPITGYTTTPPAGSKLTEPISSVAINARPSKSYSMVSTPMAINYKTPSSLKITTEPKTNYKTGEKLNLNGLVVGVLYDGENTFEQIYDYRVEYDHKESIPEGTSVVTLKYNTLEGRELTTSFNITAANDYVAPAGSGPVVVAKKCVGIKVSGTYPTKFAKGEPFNKSGLIVTALYDDKSTADIGFYTITPEVGEKLREDTTVVVSYTQDDNTFTDKYVLDVGIPERIAVASPPRKIDYHLGERLDLSGLDVEVVYTNGLKKSITGQCTFEPTNTTVIDSKDLNLRIMYDKFTIMQTLTVGDPLPGESPIIAIKIVSPPYKVVYKVGDELRTNGLTVKLIKASGEEMSTNAFSTTPENWTVLGKENKKLTVRCTLPNLTDLEDSIPLIIANPTGLVVSTSPKLQYFDGDALNLDNLRVRMNYDDDTSSEIFNYVVTPPSGTPVTRDLEKFTITFGDFTLDQRIVVKEQVNLPPVAKTPTGIKITTFAKKVYKIGETLDLNDLVVNELYSDGSYAETTNYTVTPDRTKRLTEEDTMITVTSGEFSVSQNITIKKPISIKITTSPADIMYEVGDPLNLTGMQVYTYYSDGSNEPCEDYTTSPANGAILNLENKTVTVTSGAFTATQIITVTERGEVVPEVASPVVGVTVATPPTETVYKVGDSLKLAGMVVKVIKQNGTSEVIDGYIAEPANGTALTRDNNKVKITYGSFTTEQTIRVITPVGISVNSTPNKTEYEVGDAIIMDGLTVQLNYDDESFTMINNYTVDPPNGTKATLNTTKLTISYTPNGSSVPFTTDQPIIVRGEGEIGKKTVTGLKMVSYPRKITLGERLNLDDMVVRLLYSDGSSAEVTTCTTSPERNSIITQNTTSLTVTYTKGKMVITDTKNMEVVAPKELFIMVPPKHDYQEDDVLDLTGTQLYMRYTDGSTIPINTGYSTVPNNGDRLNKNNTSILFTYIINGVRHTTSQVINVRERSVTIVKPKPSCVGIKIDRKPNNIYLKGDQLDLSEMRVIALYDDDTSAEIANYTVEPPVATPLNETHNRLYLTYTADDKEFTATTPIIVRYYTSVTITNMPKLKYEVGEQLDTTGLALQFNYNDGTSDPVDGNKITTVPANGAVLSATDVKLDITARGINDVAMKTSQKLYVNTPKPKPKVSEIKIAALPKDRYLLGDEVSLDGLRVVAVYEDGDVSQIDGYTTTVANKTIMTREITNNIITARLDDKDFKIGYQIRLKDVKDITFSKAAKAVYKKGESFDASNIVVQMNYLDGTYDEVPYGSLTIEPAHGTVFSEVGTQTLTVSYTYNEIIGVKTVTQEINIVEPEAYTVPTPVELVWTKKPNTYYADGEKILKDDVQIGMKMSDNTIRSIENFRWENSTLESTGNIPWYNNAFTLVAIYTNPEVAGGKVFKINHQLIKEIPVGMSVTKFPKTEWNEYERFNYNGLEVSLLFEHREPRVLGYHEFTISIVRNTILKATHTVVNLVYIADTNMKTFYNIIVNPITSKLVKSIKIKNYCKTEYIIGYDTIDTSDLEIEATFVDGTIGTINNWITEPVHGYSVSSSTTKMVIKVEYGPGSYGAQLEIPLRLKNYSKIMILNLPNKLVYDLNKEDGRLDLRGLKIRYIFDDTSTEDVLFDDAPYRFGITPEINAVLSAGKNVCYLYNNPKRSGSPATSFGIQVFPAVSRYLIGVRITDRPTKMIYNLNEPLSLSGLKIGAVYTNNDIIYIDNYVTDIPEGTPITNSNNIITISYAKPDDPRGTIETLKLYLTVSEPKMATVSKDTCMAELESGKTTEDLVFEPKFFVRYSDGSYRRYVGEYDILEPAPNTPVDYSDSIYKIKIRLTVDNKQFTIDHPLHVYDKEDPTKSNIRSSALLKTVWFYDEEHDILKSVGDYPTYLNMTRFDRDQNNRKIIFMTSVVFKNSGGYSMIVRMPEDRLTFATPLHEMILDFVATRDDDGRAKTFNTNMQVTATPRDYGYPNNTPVKYTVYMLDPSSRNLNITPKKYAYGDRLKTSDVIINLMHWSSTYFKTLSPAEIRMEDGETGQPIAEDTVITKNMYITYVWTDPNYYGLGMPKDLKTKIYYFIRTISSITIDMVPIKWNYVEGEPLDYTGVVITATYSDSTRGKIDSRYVEFNPPQGSAAVSGISCTAIFKYDPSDMTKAVTANMAPTVYNIDDISIYNAKTERTSYYENETLQFNYSYVRVGWSGGMGEEIWRIPALNCVTMDINKRLKPEDVTDQTKNGLVFNYTRPNGVVKEATYNDGKLRLTEVIPAIDINISGIGLFRNVGEPIDFSDIDVKVVFEDGYITELSEECMFTNLNADNGGLIVAGENRIKATGKYYDKTFEKEFIIYGGSDYVKESFGITSSENAVKMIRAATLGAFDLNDYWKVGDERTITASDGKTATMVILHMKSTTSGGTPYQVAIGFKEILGPFTTSSVSYYDNCKPDGYRSFKLKGAIIKYLNLFEDQVLFNAAKMCKHQYVNKTYNPDECLKVEERFTLPSLMEVVGESDIRGNQRQFEYYKISANRPKPKLRDTSTDRYYMLRDNYYYYGLGFRYIESGGGHSYNATFSANQGVSPIFFL